MSDIARLSAKHMKGDLYRAVRFMVNAGNNHHPDKYLEALVNARQTAQTVGVFPLGKRARGRRVQERLTLVEHAHALLDRNFAPSTALLKVYVAEGVQPTPQSDALYEALGDAYAEQSVFDPILVEQAHENTAFGTEVAALHPFGADDVTVNLRNFKAINPVHAYVVDEMLKAIFDQHNVIAVERGDMTDPVIKAAQRVGVEIGSVNPHVNPVSLPENYPTDLRESAQQDAEEEGAFYQRRFNEGWLYSFYDALATAVNTPKWFKKYAEDSHAARLLAVHDFVDMQQSYWEGQWKVYGEGPGISASDKAFFDGAVTAWDNWMDDIIVDSSTVR